MNELSTHLMVHVVPDVLLRQFVLTLPFAVRTVFLRAVSSFVRKKARDESIITSKGDGRRANETCVPYAYTWIILSSCAALVCSFSCLPSPLRPPVGR